MQKIEQVIVIVSQSPGRLRVKVEGLPGNFYLARSIQSQISALPFVEAVTANPRTGKVLIIFQPAAENVETILKNLYNLTMQILNQAGSENVSPVSRKRLAGGNGILSPDGLAGTTGLLALYWGQPLIGAGLLGLIALKGVVKNKLAKSSKDNSIGNSVVERAAQKNINKMCLITAATAAGTYMVTRNPQKTLATLVAGNPIGTGLTVSAEMENQSKELSQHGIFVHDQQAILIAKEVDTVILTDSRLLTVDHSVIEHIIPIDKTYTQENIGLIVTRVLANQNKRNLSLVQNENSMHLSENSSLILKEHNIEILIAHQAFFKKRGISLRQTRTALTRIKNLGGYSLYVVVNGQVIGVIGLHNRVSPEGWALLRGLRSLGIKRIGLLTDERKEIVAPIGSEAGLFSVEANLDTQTKKVRIKELQDSGQRVAVISSFPWDYDVLKQSDVGIYVSSHNYHGICDVFINDSGAQQGIVKFFLMSHTLVEAYQQSTIANLGGSAVGLALAVLGWLNAPWATIFALTSVLFPAFRIFKSRPRIVQHEYKQTLQEVVATLEAERYAGNLKYEYWHTTTQKQLLSVLELNNFLGLTANQLHERRQIWGFNELTQKQRTPWWRLLFNQLSDFMVKLLLGIAGFCLFIGKPIDTFTIVTIVLVNALIGMWQEARAEKSLTSLEELTVTEAVVIRDGKEQVIPARELLPGDIIVIEAGHKVPADARIIEAANLEVEEASLTGETLPVVKAANCCPEETVLGDRNNMLYLGTCVVRGRGKAVVVATGMNTEMGKISNALQSETKDEQTPLQMRLDELGKYLVYGSLAICGVVFGLGLIRGQGLLNMFLTSTSLAVAAIPEGLSTIVTIALALGVHRMSKRSLVIKKLRAIETLGCTTVICSDKTGTITKNEMTVRSVYSLDNLWNVTGEGYNPQGQFTSQNKIFEVAAKEDLNQILLIGALCNNAQLLKDESCEGGQKDYWYVQGDPTEGALLTLAAKKGLRAKNLNVKQQRISELPFESELRQMTVVCQDKEGNKTAYVKGSLDKILAKCSYVLKSGELLPLNNSLKQKIIQANNKLTARALRVLALAYKPLAEDEKYETGGDELIFAGMVGMQDPPRPEVKPALLKCKAAGIKVCMITGDHAQTATAIAEEIGLFAPGDRVVTGMEIDCLSDKELDLIVDDIRICARATPQHKIRLVKALQRKRHIVAMTGDGVNDAPAVRQADIGVVMGKNGTDVTKDVSSMIINDDNFATIVYGVEEGRTVYRNIRHAIRYLLATNVGEVVVMFLASLLGMPMPLTASQLLWLNLSGDGLPAIALVSNKASGEEMNVGPRPKDESVFANGLGHKIMRRGTFIGLGALTSFVWGLRRGGLSIARTMALASLGVSQFIHLFDCRQEKVKLQKSNLNFGNKYQVAAGLVGLGLIIGSIYVPWLSGIFQTTPLALTHWLVVLAGAGGAMGADWMFSMS